MRIDGDICISCEACVPYCPMGAIIMDADKLGHETLNPGGEVWRQVVTAFGRQIVAGNGNIDREKLLATAPKLLPPEECARVILNGVERNKATIVVTPLAKIFWLLHRVSPKFVLWLLTWNHTRNFRKVRLEG